ncbi:hypothetical protein MSPP1_002240 [Malassezia sp. CBS 17886]|nr:hypothetical protein MSPP1_002240 [Malassezia sp. CBS 17886]
MPPGCSAIRAALGVRATLTGGSAGGATARGARVRALSACARHCTADAAPRFAQLGLPPALCAHVCATLPHLHAPTAAQAELIPSMLAPRDVIMRAHTGSGKSFAVLLALLAKPRLLFRQNSGAATPGVAALVLVPSNELAMQYMAWAHQLVPDALHTSLASMVQCVVRGDAHPDTQLAMLREMPPHVVVGTPMRVREILAQPGGADLLGVHTLRTLVLDEADALLQLPGRFPSQRQVWKHLAHRAPGLDVLNTVLSCRATYSGGTPQLTAGLEVRRGARGDAQRPPEHIRRTQYRGAERTPQLAPPRAREPGVAPVQLVCMSATANSVLRHFLGARTGWLRTNTKETIESAAWHDLTGMSGSDAGAGSMHAPRAIPREISHACLVVEAPQGGAPGEALLGDAPSEAPQSDMPPSNARHSPPPPVHHTPVPPSASPVIRNLDTTDAPAAAAPARDGDRGGVAAPRASPAEHEVDTHLLEALAFAFAADCVYSGLALIPPRWSVRRTQAALEALGVPVAVLTPGAAPPAASTEPHLFLLQSSSARGLDVPGLSHVFLVGLAAVGDAVHYTHVAGRVARVGWGAGAERPASAERPPGKVVTLLRSVQDTEHAWPNATSPAEQKMARVYKRVGVVPRAFDLSLMEEGVGCGNGAPESAPVDELGGGRGRGRGGGGS